MDLTLYLARSSDLYDEFRIIPGPKKAIWCGPNLLQQVFSRVARLSEGADIVEPANKRGALLILRLTRTVERASSSNAARVSHEYNRLRQQ